jgi:NADH:ubiquinone reductase (H+-translocating)
MSFEELEKKIKSAKRVLVLGGGFGGFYAGQVLEKKLASDDDMLVGVVNEENFFLFTPMLHEVAAGDLEITHIVNPLHKHFRDVRVIAGTVESIDLKNQQAIVSYGENKRNPFRYDYLIIAIGSITNFHHIPGLEDHALTMKSLGDALFLRNRVINRLEQANVERDAEARKGLLTFTLAGGGLAGVETIASINDFLREAVKFYRHLEQSMVRVILVHPDDHLLPELGEKLGHYTEEQLRKRGIDVKLKTRVTGATEDTVQFNDGTSIPCKTLIWTAGVSPSPVLDQLDCAKDHGRIVVNEFLEVSGYSNVWAIGDCASITDPKTGKPYPATAQHALREGVVAAQNVVAAIRGGQKKVFAYTDQGRLAAIGKRVAVAQIFGFNFSGLLAWLMWRTVYWVKLPGIEKKVRVGIDWLLDLFFTKDLVQFLTLRAPAVQRHSHDDLNGELPQAPATMDARPVAKPPERMSS